MCKVLRDYGTVAGRGSKELKLQTITNFDKEKRLALVSYKDGMSVNITDITDEAKKLKELLEGYLDYKTPEKVKEVVNYNKDNVHALTTLPALDGNYKGALAKSSDEDIEEAVKQMQKGGAHATRIKVCQAELKRRNKANTKPQTVSEKATPKAEKKKEEAKIIPFPTEDKKPQIIPLKTEGESTYGECAAKLLMETKELQDADNRYVITGLLELLKIDGDFRNNFMRKEKSYAGFEEYMFDAVQKGYCGRKGNMAWLDKDSALGLAIDYFNADLDTMKAEEEKKREEERAKREAEVEKLKSKTTKPKGVKRNGKNVRKKKGRTAS